MEASDITVKLPADLLKEMMARVESGEFKSPTDIVEAAIRYYLQRHSAQDMAGYVDEEIRAGLEGSS